MLKMSKLNILDTDVIKKKKNKTNSQTQLNKVYFEIISYKIRTCSNNFFRIFLYLFVTKKAALHRKKFKKKQKNNKQTNKQTSKQTKNKS